MCPTWPWPSHRRDPWAGSGRFWGAGECRIDAAAFVDCGGSWGRAKNGLAEGWTAGVVGAEPLFPVLVDVGSVPSSSRLCINRAPTTGWGGRAGALFFMLGLSLEFETAGLGSSLGAGDRRTAAFWAVWPGR